MTVVVVTKKEVNSSGGVTATELADKCAMDLCFRFDGNFAPRYKCLSKRLQVLIVDEENAGEEELEREEKVHCNMAEVSLNSFSGLTPP